MEFYDEKIRKKEPKQTASSLDNSTRFSIKSEKRNGVDKVSSQMIIKSLYNQTKPNAFDTLIRWCRQQVIVMPMLKEVNKVPC